MREVDTRIITMTLQEFKAWECPVGWVITMISGEQKIGRIGSKDGYFEVRVHLELMKELQ